MQSYPNTSSNAQQIALARLQFEESHIVVGAIQGFMEMGIPSYPVHDSLIVSSVTQGVAEGVLEGCFRERLGACSFEIKGA